MDGRERTHSNSRVESCACADLRQASRAVTSFYDRFMQPGGLPIAQYSLLRAIELNEHVTISALAAMMSMDRTTLTRNLGPLLRRSYVAVKPGRDKRSRSIALTGRGREALRRSAIRWDRARIALAARLGEATLARLRRLMPAVVQAAGRGAAGKRNRKRATA